MEEARLHTPSPHRQIQLDPPTENTHTNTNTQHRSQTIDTRDDQLQINLQSSKDSQREYWHVFLPTYFSCSHTFHNNAHPVISLPTLLHKGSFLRVCRFERPDFFFASFPNYCPFAQHFPSSLFSFNHQVYTQAGGEWEFSTQSRLHTLQISGSSMRMPRSAMDAVNHLRCRFAATTVGAVARFSAQSVGGGRSRFRRSMPTMHLLRFAECANRCLLALFSF